MSQTTNFDRFRCEVCRTPHDSVGRCDELGCGGRVREYLPMEPPVYEVDVGGFGPIWFPADGYDGAFQHATGMRIEAAGDDHEQETEITLVDFDAPVDVPVADF